MFLACKTSFPMGIRRYSVKIFACGAIVGEQLLVSKIRIHTTCIKNYSGHGLNRYGFKDSHFS